MHPNLTTLIRTFFASSGRPRLRRDLVDEMRVRLDLDTRAAEALIAGLIASGLIGTMQVHFYDGIVEDLVQEPGVRLGCGLGGEVDSGQWRAVLANA